MKINKRICDMCKKTLPMRNGASVQRYKVKVKLIDKYADWGDEDMPTTVRVDLCPNCMRNLCEGVLLLNRKEEHED